MPDSIYTAFKYLVGFTFAVLFLPIALAPIALPLSVVLALIIWPSAFVIFCVASVTFIFWLPALVLFTVFISIPVGILRLCFQIAVSLLGTLRDALRQPPQHPGPYQDVPALPSGIPASRSNSALGTPSRPLTPAADAATDPSSWLELRYGGMTPRTEELEFSLPAGERGVRSYPPRRSSSIIGASSSSVNTGTTVGHSTTSVNSILSTSTNRSTAGPPTPDSPVTPTRRRSRTKSMSFEDGTRPGLTVSHSTTSMVTGSPRVSSQHGPNSSTTSLGSNAGSVAGSIEGAAATLSAGQLFQEASEDDIVKQRSDSHIPGV